MMKRRALYDVLPLDPTAWPVLLAAHREELRNTMAEQAVANKVDLSAMQAPGAQVTPSHKACGMCWLQASVVACCQALLIAGDSSYPPKRQAVADGRCSLLQSQAGSSTTAVMEHSITSVLQRYL